MKNVSQKNLDQMSEKKRLQEQYRSMLDNQRLITKQMYNGYGNMTNVEKKMNRADLLAYKSYDNKQYSLIPGVQHAYIKKNMGIAQANTAIDDANQYQPRRS